MAQTSSVVITKLGNDYVIPEFNALSTASYVDSSTIPARDWYAIGYEFSCYYDADGKSYYPGETLTITENTTNLSVRWAPYLISVMTPGEHYTIKNIETSLGRTIQDSSNLSVIFRETLSLDIVPDDGFQIISVAVYWSESAYKNDSGRYRTHRGFNRDSKIYSSVNLGTSYSSIPEDNRYVFPLTSIAAINLNSTGYGWAWYSSSNSNTQYSKGYRAIVSAGDPYQQEGEPYGFIMLSVHTAEDSQIVYTNTAATPWNRLAGTNTTEETAEV